MESAPYISSRTRPQASRTTARDIPSTFCPALVAVRSTRTVLSSSLTATLPLTSIVAPWSSFGTTTGLVKRTPYSTTAPGSPVQSVTTRIASAMVNMPCAMTSGSPTSLANFSFQWIGLKSPDAPAYRTRASRVTGEDWAGRSVPPSTSAYAILAVICSGLLGRAGDQLGPGGHHVLAGLVVDFAADVQDVVAGHGLDGIDGRGDGEPVAGPHRADVGELLVAVHHTAVVQAELGVLDDLARGPERD